MAEYVIRVDYDSLEPEWYLGSTYIFQGSRYPSIGDLREAKRYSSHKRAEKAAESIRSLAGGIKSCEVVEIEDLKAQPSKELH